MGEPRGWNKYLKEGERQFNITKNDTGEEFINRWRKAYNEYQWDTPSISEATLHLCLGQVPSVRDMRIHTSGARYEDGRVHVLWLQPSGTGKQGGMDFVQDICYNMEFNDRKTVFETPHKFTDAALIGTYETIKMWDKSVRGYVEKQVLVPGYLSKGTLDIFAMPECSVLFETKSQYNEDTMVFFQRTMDPMGRNEISKKLARGNKITVNPTCSFFLSSYVPPSFTKKTVERGLVQRMLTIINQIPVSARVKNIEKAMNNIGIASNKIENLKEEIQYLSYYLMELNEPYGKLKALKCENKMMKNFRVILYEIQEMMEGLPKYKQEELSKFMNRCMTQAIKIAYHHAIIRRDNKIEIEDIGYAHEYLKPIWSNLIHYFEDALEDNVAAARREEYFEGMLKATIRKLEEEGFGKNGWVIEPMLVSYLAKELRKKKEYMQKKVNDEVDSALLERGKIKNIKVIRLKPMSG